ncbi:MAG: TIGR03560 family F420-dependent LLM class oxidoreductase [Actinomycetota bacterium]
MRFGLDTAQHQLSWNELLGRVRLAEEFGFDGAWVFDHFKPLYADPSGPCLEAWTLLAGLAAETERIRLGPLVTGMTYRHPSVLAAEALTVDHISGGRLELAVGAAWFEQEHRELGIEFPSVSERIDRLDEGVQVLRLLLTQDDATFDGAHFRLETATLHPRPVQSPHPPIWIGGSGERRMLPLIGRLADVWHGFGSAEELVGKSRIVDRAATDAGRRPGDIVRSTSLSIEDLDQARARVDAVSEAGFSYLTVGWPSQGRSRVEEFVAAFLR